MTARFWRRATRIWDRSFAINIRGMARMTQAFLPRMIENGGGSIINMASVVSAINGGGQPAAPMARPRGRSWA